MAESLSFGGAFGREWLFFWGAVALSEILMMDGLRKCHMVLYGTCFYDYLGAMGHAYTDDGFIQLLKSKAWLALICKHMECYPFMHHVECLETTQCVEF